MPQAVLVGCAGEGTRRRGRCGLVGGGHQDAPVSSGGPVEVHTGIK